MKKAGLISIAFLILVTIVSSVFIGASDDASLNIPDNTNYVFCGASQCESSFIPQIIDENLGTRSYNLSVKGLKLYGRYELLKKVLPDYNIGTVVFDISFDTLTRAEAATGISDMRVRRFLGKYADLSYYFFNPFSLQRLQENYGGLMSTGFDVLWKKTILHLKGEYSEHNMRSCAKEHNRGFDEYSTVDVSINESGIISSFNTLEIDTELRTDRLHTLEECINLCKEYNADILFVVVPVPDASIWIYNGLDKYYQEIMLLANKYDCALYDFNLYKGRYLSYSDKSSFRDLSHMSTIGAEQFSYDYAYIMDKVTSGEDVSEYFYSSYAELRNGSPYMDYYLAHIND